MCHIVSQIDRYYIPFGVVCDTITAMKNDSIIDTIADLRTRLEPIERISHLMNEAEKGLSRPRKAAVLLGLFDQDSKLYIAFIRRSEKLRSHSGEIAFPGGSLDASDTSLVETALREAEEEIGLDPVRVEVLGVLEPVFTMVSNFIVLPVVAFLPDGLGDLSLQSSEVAELILASLPGLADPSIARTENWTRHGVTMPVFFYEYGPYTIWGATARMLKTLLSVYQPPVDDGAAADYKAG